MTGSKPRSSALLLVVFLLAGCSRDRTDRVAWVPVAGAEAAARAAGKPIFYDFTADWCSPCQLMKRDLFSHRQSAETLNMLFVPVQVLDRSRENGRNGPEVSELQERFGVEAFPTLVVAAPGGGEPVVIEGYGGRGATLQALVEASMKVKLAMRAAPVQGSETSDSASAPPASARRPARRVAPRSGRSRRPTPAGGRA